MINLRSGAQEMETNITVQDLPLLLPALLQRSRPKAATDMSSRKKTGPASQDKPD
jgi:hypothetical protein